jgi:hypothetical protein
MRPQVIVLNHTHEAARPLAGSNSSKGALVNAPPFNGFNPSTMMPGIDAVLADTPYNLWSMDELRGRPIQDIMGHQNGLNGGGIVFGNPGKWPNTLCLTSNSNLTVMGGIVSLSAGSDGISLKPLFNEDFSIEVCFFGNIFASTKALLSNQVNVPPYQGLQCWGDNTTTNFIFAEAPLLYSLASWPTSVFVNDWNVLCITYAQTTKTLTVYANGFDVGASLSGVGCSSGPAYHPDIDTLFGGSIGSANFLPVGSKLDYFAYWRGVVLTSTQVREHFLGRVMEQAPLMQMQMQVPLLPGDMGMVLVGETPPPADISTFYPWQADVPYPWKVIP